MSGKERRGGLQVKMSRGGAEMTTAGGDKIWTSPQRDVVHNFLSTVGRSMQFIHHYANTNPALVELLAGMDAKEIEDGMEAFVTALGKFAAMAVEARDRKMTVTEAAQESGLVGNAALPKVWGAIGYSFLNMMLSMYWAGVRDMAGAGHAPFTENNMNEVVDVLAGIKSDNEQRYRDERRQ